MKFKIGVDVGGTFTDFLLVDEKGDAEIYKTLSTPRDLTLGFFNGIKEMAEAKGLGLANFLRQVEIIVHGTTVTTNAVLTNNGVKTGLLTTKGFRDALQMRRGQREVLYDNKYRAPDPLVPRYLRLPVEERVTLDGKVVTTLNREDVVRGAQRFREEQVQAVAVCFLHSYANMKHEQEAGDLLRELLPEAYLTLSCDLLPQIRFYDRVSSTVLNSYVGPILDRYLANLTQKLQEAGYQGILLIMQSNGGVTSPQVAMRTAASTLLSGPAAGPIAGLAYISIHGYNDCITIDMGGTSFDAALVKDRTPLVTTEARVNRHLLALPTLWIHTIGAGGGSIGWVDEGGLLRMGPQSAGADPGPACYGLGGEKPTCTDADLLLGYLNKDYFLGGKIALDYQRAKEAIHRHIATPLGLDVVEAAAGMYQVINVNMAAGVKEVSVQRGFDPRDFPLIVAGGAGPVHAGSIALELEIPLIIIPKESSIFCAAGMLLSDLKHDFVRSYTVDVAKVDPQRFRALFAEMEEEGGKVLGSENIPRERMNFLYSCDLRYVGQYYEVNVDLTTQEIEDCDFGSIVERFHLKHDQLYGYHLKEEGMPTEIINLRATAMGVTDKPRFKEEDYAGEDSSQALKGHRPVYLPQSKRFEQVAVFDGARLRYGNKVVGPAIIEQPNTSIFVLPEFNVVCDKYGSYTMYLRTREREFAERLRA